MLTLKVYTTVILLLAPFSSFAADDCSPVRLDEKGGSMEHVATRTQVGGTCYAETAVQLFDAYRSLQGMDISSTASGFIASLGYTQKRGRDTINGGVTCDAFNYILDHGVVSEDKYNQTYLLPDKKISGLAQSLDGQREHQIKEMEKARARFEAEKADTNRFALPKDNLYIPKSYDLLQMDKSNDQALFMEKYGNAILKQSLTMASYYLNLYFSKNDAEAALPVMVDLFENFSSNQLEFLSRIVALHYIPQSMRSYLNRNRPNCVDTAYNYFTPSKTILDDLNKNFKEGKKSIPFAIKFCSSIYAGGRAFNPGSRFISGNGFKNYEGCGLHATVVIGRRKNPVTNRCQYLIKNSEGKDYCPENIKDWQCEKSSSALWIDADKLSEATAAIITIQK